MEADLWRCRARRLYTWASSFCGSYGCFKGPFGDTFTLFQLFRANLWVGWNYGFGKLEMQGRATPFPGHRVQELG